MFKAHPGTGRAHHLLCVCDNSTANRSNPDRIDVKWGDQTWEMHTGLLYSLNH
jgi:hypothetical protein